MNQDNSGHASSTGDSRNDKLSFHQPFFPYLDQLEVLLKKIKVSLGRIDDRRVSIGEGNDIAIFLTTLMAFCFLILLYHHIYSYCNLYETVFFCSVLLKNILNNIILKGRRNEAKKVNNIKLI